MTVYLTRIAELRHDIGERIERLSQPRYRRALAECRDALEAELDEAPRGLRSGAPLRSTDEVLDAEAPFFQERGPLSQLCERIDESARAVLRKMHRHLRDMERRSARLVDLRARLAELAALECADDAGDPRLARFVRELLGSAHVRMQRHTPGADERLVPPLPRTHKAAPPGQSSRPLKEKGLGADDARALRSRREADLGAWLEDRLLRGQERVLLSEAGLTEPEAARRWLDAARAAHLAGSRALTRMGFGLDWRESRVVVGAAALGMEAPECELRRTVKR